MNELGWVDFVGAGGVPVVLLIVQIFVKPWVSDTRFYPIAAIIAGVLLNVIAGLAMQSPWERVALYCLLTGLASSGTYSTQERVRSLVARPDQGDGDPPVVPRG